MNEQYIRQNTETYVPFSHRLFSFLAVMMMLGSVYVFPLYKALDMGEVLFFVFVPYFLAKNNQMTVSRKHSLIGLFVIYSFLAGIVMCIFLRGDISSPLVRMTRDAFYYFIIFFLGYHFFDMKSFRKILLCFCTILSVFVILQVLCYALTGYLIPGFLMNATLNDGGYVGAQLNAKYMQYAINTGYLKPNGFLCEPAHCAQCFFVAILLLLFGNGDKKKDLKIAIVISIGMVLTMSTSAMLYLAFAWGLWALREAKRNFAKIMVIAILFLILVGIALRNGQLDSVISVIQRFTKLLSGDTVTGSNSAQIRMLKGFLTFMVLPPMQKLFGIGFGNYSAALSSVIGNAQIILVENEYMNTVSYILVSAGIAGSLLMLLFFISIFLNGGRITKIMIAALLIISLGSSIYSSPICIWLMLLILYSERGECSRNGRRIDSELQ